MGSEHMKVTPAKLILVGVLCFVVLMGWTVILMISVSNSLGGSDLTPESFASSSLTAMTPGSIGTWILVVCLALALCLWLKTRNQIKRARRQSIDGSLPPQ